MLNVLRKWAYQKLVLCCIGLLLYKSWAAQFLNVAYERSLAYFYLYLVGIIIVDLFFNIWLLLACYSKLLCMFEIYRFYIFVNISTMSATYLSWVYYVIVQSKIDFGNSSVLMQVMFSSITVLGIIANHVYVFSVIKKEFSKWKFGDEDNKDNDNFYGNFQGIISDLKNDENIFMRYHSFVIYYVPTPINVSKRLYVSDTKLLVH